jgi:O-methyltransferase domain
MGSVLHDWPDEDAVRILETVRRVMNGPSRLVLFEAVIVPRGKMDLGRMLDLHMLVLFGAKERTYEDWESLLARGGFTLERVIPTPGLSWIEAYPTA